MRVMLVEHCEQEKTNSTGRIIETCGGCSTQTAKSWPSLELHHADLGQDEDDWSLHKGQEERRVLRAACLVDFGGAGWPLSPPWRFR